MAAKQFKYEDALNKLTEVAQKASDTQAKEVSLVREVILRWHEDYRTDDLEALRTYIDTLLKGARRR